MLECDSYPVKEHNDVEGIMVLFERLATGVHCKCFYSPADKFLKERQYFRDGRLDRDGLVAFIKEVKNYPGLTDEDAAVLAASKLVSFVGFKSLFFHGQYC